MSVSAGSAHTFWNLSAYMVRRAPFLITRKVLETVLNLATFAILARTLTVEAFGIYTIVFVFVAVLRLTSIPGLGTAIAQSFARRHGGGFRRAVAVSISGSLFGSVVLSIGSWWYLADGEIDKGHALLVAAAFFPLLSGLLYWRNAAVGSEHYVRLLFYDVAAAAVRLAGVAACAFQFDGALLPIVIAALGGHAAVNVLATLHQMRLSVRGQGMEHQSLNYGLLTTAYQVPSIISEHLDKAVLFFLFSAETLAVYAVAMRIPQLARVLVGEANATLGPVFARQKDYSPELRRFSIGLSILYMAIAVVGTLLVIPVVLPLLAGQSYGSAVPYAQLMMLGVALGFLGDVQFRFIKSQLDSRSFLHITVGSTVVNVPLVLALGYGFGLSGVVAAYILRYLSYTLICTFVVRSYSRNLQTDPAPAASVERS